MSSHLIISNCPNFADFDEYVNGIIAIAQQQGQGEVPAALSDVVVPVVVAHTHRPYSSHGTRAVVEPRGPLQVGGYLAYVPFVATASPASTRAKQVSARPENIEDLITLIVGCTYFFVDEAELKRTLEMATGARVLGLRPQLRRRTQRTGLWFVDVSPRHLPAFLAMDRCMLMHSAGTYIYAAGSQARLRKWTDARDTALMLVKGADKHHKGLKPVTIEVSKGFEEKADAVMAACQPSPSHQ